MQFVIQITLLSIINSLASRTVFFPLGSELVVLLRMGTTPQASFHVARSLEFSSMPQRITLSTTVNLLIPMLFRPR